MCRFIAYLGTPMLMDEILFKPKNSLIHQSIQARETSEPLNGDGFGVGWYNQKIDPTPAVFTSIQPAWNDQNLENIAHKIESNCMFAHIRSASVGGVSTFNCHPFHSDRFLFMHNGKLGEFNKIKRKLATELSEMSYEWIKGQTDSEHLCALFLDVFRHNKGKFNVDDIGAVLRETIERVERLMAKESVQEASFINVAITDGQSMVAIRQTNDPKVTARSLYYSAGKQFALQGDICRMIPAENNVNQAVLVVSEKLTSYKADWQPVASNSLLKVDQQLNITVETL